MNYLMKPSVGFVACVTTYMYPQPPCYIEKGGISHVSSWCCVALFLVVPLLSDSKAVTKLLSDAMISGALVSVEPMAELIIDRLKRVGVKSALRLVERAVVSASSPGTSINRDELGSAQLSALADILEDLAGDEVTAQNLCEIY
jgi:hypothetical protein